VVTKHRMMVNVDRSVYEWIRAHAHATRMSMSGVLNELVKIEMIKSAAETGIAADCADVVGVAS
jgi:hypothetical protein